MARLGEDHQPGVAVQVDEARRDDLAARMDQARRPADGVVDRGGVPEDDEPRAAAGDLARHAHRRREAGRARPIDDRAVDDQELVPAAPWISIVRHLAAIFAPSGVVLASRRWLARERERRGDARRCHSRCRPLEGRSASRRSSATLVLVLGGLRRRVHRRPVPTDLGQPARRSHRPPSPRPPPGRRVAAAATAEPAPALNGARVTFKNGDLTLGAMVWKPAGHGPFPAVLWNHGSEKGPGGDGSNPLLGPVFAAQGYVFFMPFRRGQGTSQGTWIVDATNAAAPAEQPALIARLHATEQLSDQLAGLAYLRSLSYVDDGNVAVAGWSYGGIQTVLGAGDASAGISRSRRVHARLAGLGRQLRPAGRDDGGGNGRDHPVRVHPGRERLQPRPRPGS